MYAKIAAYYISAYCRETFNDNPEQMESTLANGEMIDVFYHKGGGTHKYIPTDRLNDDLSLPLDCGVFSYWMMSDGSYLLRTCRGPLAYWSGRMEDKAEFPQKREKKI